MDDVALVGSHFGRFDPDVLLEIAGDSEVFIGHDAGSGHVKLLADIEDQIGLADVPTVDEFSSGFGILAITLRRAGAGPGSDGSLFGFVQTAIIPEVAEFRIGEPRGHFGGQDRLADGGGPRAHFCVRGERHRRGLALAVTLDTALFEDRRDILVVGQASGR